MITMLTPNKYRDAFEVSLSRAGPYYADAGRLISELCTDPTIDAEFETETNTYSFAEKKNLRIG